MRPTVNDNGLDITVDCIRAILLRDDNSHAHYNVLHDNCRHCACETYSVYSSHLIYSGAGHVACAKLNVISLHADVGHPHGTACNLIPRRRSNDAARTLSNASAEIFARANSCSFAMTRARERNATRSFFKICSGFYGARLMADDGRFFFSEFLRIAWSRSLVRSTAV